MLSSISIMLGVSMSVSSNYIKLNKTDHKIVLSGVTGITRYHWYQWCHWCLHRRLLECVLVLVTAPATSLDERVFGGVRDLLLLFLTSQEGPFISPSFIFLSPLSLSLSHFSLSLSPCLISLSLSLSLSVFVSWYGHDL